LNLTTRGHRAPVNAARGRPRWHLAVPASANIRSARIGRREAITRRDRLPLADRITASRLHNLKELRPGSAGRTEIRILFIFDPQRQAVLARTA
jgi:hypothetical protein